MKPRLVTCALLGATIAGVAAVMAQPADALTIRLWRGYLGNGLWSEATNWNNGKPENGDLLDLGTAGSGRLKNDIPNLSIARLTLSGSDYQVEGNALTITESIVASGSGKNALEIAIGGVAQTLVGEDSTLVLSGNNTFSGQIDIAGELHADSNSALGGTAGETRIFDRGELHFTGRDFGMERIRMSPQSFVGLCGIVNEGGSSVLRDLQVGGLGCIVNLIADATLTYPNGIGQFAPGFDVLLYGGTHIVGGTSNAVGPLRVTGETDIVWNSVAELDISFEPVFETLPDGDLRGFGSAASVNYRSGTFSPGTGNATARFTVTGALAMQDATFSALLNSSVPATGYSQVAAATVTIGAETELELRLGFEPAIGTQFRIVDNTGAQPVAGTFAGLAEGATFSRGGRTWRITYTGGTGNDVVVTRVADDPRPFKRTLPMVGRS